MEAKTRQTRDQYIASSKEVVAKHFKEDGLTVSYIRSKPAPKGRKLGLSEDQIKAIRTFLNITGGNIPVMPSLQILNSILPDNQALLVCDAAGRFDKQSRQIACEAFEAVKSHWLSRRSEIKGVVVTFTKDGETYAGWSLCRTEDSIRFDDWGDEHEIKGDEFNRYIGIRKAMKNAKFIRTVEQILRDGSPWDASDEDEPVLVPHSVVAPLQALITRTVNSKQLSEVGKVKEVQEAAR